VAGPCKHDTESLVFIKCGEFLVQLRKKKKERKGKEKKTIVCGLALFLRIF
jgi:hypothetical protein